MAKKVYVGVKGKNIFKATENTGKSHIGVTYSCDEETQEYTLNGTTTNTGDLILESNLDLDWEIGTPYTVTIIQTGGTAVLGTGSDISYSFSIFANNNTSYLRGSLSNTEFPGTISFSGNAIEDITGGKYAFYLQLWRIGTVFDNYKFKVQIEKGTTSTEYMPYNKSFASVVKKIYVGIANVARKVKKGFIGVAGIARQFFGISQKLIYYGTVSDLPVTIYNRTGGSSGNYALFAGGVTSAYSSRVDYYDSNLVVGTTTSLSNESENMASTNLHTILGDYVLFAGGEDASSYRTRVYCYSENLYDGHLANLPTGVANLAATNVGGYALFAGGNNASLQAQVIAYDSDTAQTELADLRTSRSYLAGTTVGDYALFGGGYSSQKYLASVETYDSNLVRGTASDLNVGSMYLAATTVGDYALFAGGMIDSSDTMTNVVTAYNKNLVKTSITNLAEARFKMGVTTVGDYAIFAGGQYQDSYIATSKTVDAYDKDLVKSTDISGLSTSRGYVAGATVGNYALFAGGRSSGSRYKTVDAYYVI